MSSSRACGLPAAHSLGSQLSGELIKTLYPSGGYLAHSLAVMTDAAHLLTDFASMLISLFSLWMSSRPATKTMNFGWQRAGEGRGSAGDGVEKEGGLEQGFLGGCNGWIPHSSPE